MPLSVWSTVDFLCLSKTEQPHHGGNFRLIMLTYMDLHGKYTGSKYSIFDVEVPMPSADEAIFEMKTFLGKILSLPIHSSREIFGSYTMNLFGKTANSIFQLLDCIRTHRFYSFEQRSHDPIKWNLSTGQKSFLSNLHTLVSFDWLSNRKKWALTGDPNPDCIELDLDIFRMFCYHNGESSDRQMKIVRRRGFRNTLCFPAPSWISCLNAESCIIRISNLPTSVPVQETFKRLTNLFLLAGTIVGYAGYYLPPCHRDCAFVLIGFAEPRSAAIAVEGGHHCLVDDKFVTVEIIDLSFCSTLAVDDGKFYAVYADLK